MRKRIIALSLSMLFLGGMTMTGFAQVNNTVAVTKVKDDDDKKKKKTSSKKDCKTASKKDCCKHDFESKECNDKSKKQKDKLK